jgi:hypothetical protein
MPGADNGRHGHYTACGTAISWRGLCGPCQVKADVANKRAKEEGADGGDGDDDE